MNTKICSSCQQEKDTDSFRTKNQRGKVYVLAKCKACESQYIRDRYKDDPDVKKRIKANNKITLKRNQDYIYNYLQGKTCVDCGEDDIIVLEFNHINPTDKKKDIAQLISSGYSIECIQEELDKCNIMCANCHRRHTYKQNGSYRSKW